MHSGRIGGLKRSLCEVATGDVFVEVDHDDLLAEGALAYLEKAFADPEVGFAYSDFADFDEATGAALTFAASSGWLHYPVTVRGRSLTAHRAFAPDARSVCEVYWAPNHVRAWRKTTYWEAGGHDATLTVGDDHELICRTYLVTRFAHVKECLYLYRFRADGRNSYKLHYQQVQIQQAKNRDLYLQRLVERWSDLEGLHRLDLGGAVGCPKGWTCIDVADADLLCDVRNGISLPDHSVGAIRAHDFLEHLTGSEAIALMNECWRLLAPGGWLLTCTPHSSGLGAWCDLTHKSAWNELSFRYFTRAECAAYYARHDPPFVGRYQLVRLAVEDIEVGPPQRMVPYVKADLMAVHKGQRVPGEVHI